MLSNKSFFNNDIINYSNTNLVYGIYGLTVPQTKQFNPCLSQLSDITVLTTDTGGDIGY